MLALSQFWLIYKAHRDRDAAIERIIARGTPSEEFRVERAAIQAQLETTLIGVGVSLFLVAGAALHALWIASGKDADADRAANPTDLLGCLHVFYEAVKRLKGIDGSILDAHRFRATIHRVEGDKHEQAVPYVGYNPDPDRKPGRKFDNRSGLVGRAIRAPEQIQRAQIGVSTDAAIEAALVSEYGYTLKEARELSPRRLSSIAVPIRLSPGGPATAVLYCDSSEATFFDSDDVITLAVAAGTGIASFIQLRYS